MILLLNDTTLLDFSLLQGHFGIEIQYKNYWSQRRHWLDDSSDHYLLALRIVSHIFSLCFNSCASNDYIGYMDYIYTVEALKLFRGWKVLWLGDTKVYTYLIYSLKAKSVDQALHDRYVTDLHCLCICMYLTEE